MDCFVVQNNEYDYHVSFFAQYIFITDFSYMIIAENQNLYFKKRETRKNLSSVFSNLQNFKACKLRSLEDWRKMRVIREK